MKFRVRVLVPAIVTVVCLAAFAKDFRLSGYVHSVHDRSFELNGVQVNCEPGTVIEPPAGAESGKIPPSCKWIRVGDHVLVSGELTSASSVLKAKRIVIDPITIESKVRNLALIESAPQLVKSGNGWSGELYVDGRTLQITPATKLSFDEPSTNTGSGQQISPLQSVEQVGPNVYVAYEAVPSYEGKLEATQLIFSVNDTTAAELDFRKREDPQVQLPDYVSKVPGIVEIGSKDKYFIRPDKAMQERVKQVGLRLIPEFQREMPESNPGKLHFQFWVIDSKNSFTMSSSNGLVMIPESLVSRFKNDAQLAAALSFSIAQIVQEQEFRYRDRRELQRILGWTSIAGSFLSPAASLAGLVNSGTLARFLRLQNEQAVRVGMDYMRRAGFDIRETGPAWAATRNKPIDAGDAQVALGRYAFDEIRRYHFQDDFDSLRLNLDVSAGSLSTLAK